MEQNIVLGNKRKFVFHFLSSLFFISAISLFEIGGIYSFINDKSKIGAFIQLISIFIAFLLFWRKKYIIPFDGMMRITYIFFLVICTFTVIRGICDPLPNWNLWSYLFNPFMLYMFLIPLVVLLPTPLVNLVYVSKISKFLLPFCIFYIITNFYELFSVQELMAMRSYDLMIIGQRSQIPSQILLPVLFFLPMTKNKAYKLAAVIVLIIATIALLLWGRRSCFVCTLLVALPFFDYMIRNNFLDIEDDICEDFDGRMYRAVKYDPWQDFSQYNGLTGYGRYWMTRLNFPTPAMQARECLTSIVKLIEEHLPDISAEEQIDVYCFLYDLQEISGSDRYTGLLEQCRRIWGVQSPDLIQAIPRLKESVVGNIARVYLHHRYLHEPIHDNVDITLKQIPDLEMGKAPVATGLLNGYAGEGMIRLAALDRANISWVNLL